MSLGLLVRLGLRESRRARGRLAFFALCLAVGVAAVVAVASLTASLEQGIRLRARELLAADLAVEGRRALPPELDERLARIPGAQTTLVQEMVTLVGRPGANGAAEESLLAELKVVGGAYPFYGELELAPDAPLDAGPEDRLTRLLGPDLCVVAPELLDRLGVLRGESILIGGQPFTIAGEVLAEPDRLDFSITAGPRVFLSAAGLARAGLDKRGSRVEHRALVKLPADWSPARTNALAEELRATLPDAVYLDVETWHDAQPTLRRALRQVDAFLGLAALLSLWIGGIGVAQTVRAWLAGRIDAIAVHKCIGLGSREILALYAGQILALGLVGSAIGAGIGIAIAMWVPTTLGALLPAGFEASWQPSAVGRGIGIGLVVAVLFGLPPLVGIVEVPPLRVLRRSVEPPAPLVRARRITMLGTALGLVGTAWLQSGSPGRALAFSAAVLATAGLLALVARALTWTAARLPREGLGFALRHGVAALGRPGAGTESAVLALGLGVLAVLAMHLVETRLERELATALPADAPTTFLADVQPDQWEGVGGLLREHGAEGVDSVPVVVARLAAVDGLSIESFAEERILTAEDELETRWILTREQRLTYLEELPPDNVVVRGALWSDPERAEVSIEEDYAADLGVDVGSTLTFDVQGVPMELLVSSVRSVDWRTFAINFFLVVEPGVLEAAPQLRVAACRLTQANEDGLRNALAARYGNVTLIPLREVLTKVMDLLARLGAGVRLLGVFTVVAGLVILVGAVSATTLRRGREAALFKALGLTRFGVLGLYAIEYALVGLAAGAIGVLGASALAWVVVSGAMQLAWSPDPIAAAAALAVSAIASVGAGLAASLGALARPAWRALCG